MGTKGKAEQSTRILRFRKTSIMKMLFVALFTLTFFHTMQESCADTLLDLNLATAAFREPATSTPQEGIKVPLAFACFASLALLSILSFWAIQPNAFSKAAASAQWAATNLLVYALNADRKSGTDRIFQEAKTLDSGKKTPRPPPRARSSFSLHSELKPCSLAVSPRHELAPALDNTLMRATLEQPKIDVVAVEYVCKNCACKHTSTCNYEAELEKLCAEEPAAQSEQDKLNSRVKQLSNRGLGKKPDIRRLKNLDKVNKQKLLNFSLDESDDFSEEEEHDWESDERASPAPCGDAMEGEDAGATPLHTLTLPSSAKNARQYGVCGRSLLSVEVGPELCHKRSYEDQLRVEANLAYLGWNKKSKMCSSKRNENRRPARRGIKPKFRSEVPAFSLD